jgi:hypothetical protein
MDARTTNISDGAAVILKQKRTTRHVAHLTGALTATSIPANTQRTPRSPWISLRVLEAALRKMTPPNIMFEIIRHYEQFVVCKVGPINAYVLDDKISLMYHVVLV